jgi:hypothetical protein
MIYLARCDELDWRYGCGGSADCAIFKFGCWNGDAPTLARRFDDGYLKPDGRRTRPLAWCRGWEVMGMWEGGKAVETVVLRDILPRRAFGFHARARIEAVMRVAPLPSTTAPGFNGIGELRVIRTPDLAGIEARLVASPAPHRSAVAAVRVALAWLALRTAGAPVLP